MKIRMVRVKEVVSIPAILGAIRSEREIDVTKEHSHLLIELEDRGKWVIISLKDDPKKKICYIPMDNICFFIPYFVESAM